MANPNQNLLSLAAWIIILLALFAGAVQMTRQPPLFRVQAVALDRQIDTSAIYYTDLEEFAMAEDWIQAALSR